MDVVKREGKFYLKTSKGFREIIISEVLEQFDEKELTYVTIDNGIKEIKKDIGYVA